MPEGSLDNHLFRRDSSSSFLSWSLRMRIALGAAKGLAFLHMTAINVIHRGVQCSNILLDSNFKAKLSDFGLAIDGPTEGRRRIHPTKMSKEELLKIQTLDIVAENPDKFRVVALTAGSNVTLLADQVKTFRPQLVAVRNESLINELKEALADCDRNSRFIGVSSAGLARYGFANSLYYVMAR